MKVGREMDALVMWRVFDTPVPGTAFVSWWDGPSIRVPDEGQSEWDTEEPVYVANCVCDAAAEHERTPGDDYWDIKMYGHHPQCFQPVPAYSTDIAAAYLVMQKLGLALVPQSEDDGFAWLACDLQAVRYGAAGILLVPKDAAISAPTAPEAVCRAALASVGVRDE